MILVMGGTKDARLLLTSLRAANPTEMIVATAVSDYGADLLRKQGGCTVLQGAMDTAALARFIREKDVRALIDATHPFAEQASAEARQAAQKTGVPYLRFERPPGQIEAGDGVYYAADFAAAAKIAARLGKIIFLTIGSRHLRDILDHLPDGKKVVARVLPDADSIRQCTALGLIPAEIVAMQGPASKALNIALFKEYSANVIITKDSGETGGTPEKVAAARELKIPIILVRRPPSPGGINSPAEIISALKKIPG
jgi:precorrin-6A/cobalt-precorrin-6A reductase